MPDAGSILVAARDQVSCDIGGEVAILHLGSGIYYGLDPVGARIWELIQTPRSLADLEKILVEEYDAAAERVTADLHELFEQLARAGLVERM
jgi:hypothetical protein